MKVLQKEFCRPVLTQRRGHKMKIIQVAPAVPPPEKCERGTPEKYAVRARRAGVPEPRRAGHVSTYDRSAPKGPICGATFEKLVSQLQAIDERSKARLAA